MTTSRGFRNEGYLKPATIWYGEAGGAPTSVYHFNIGFPHRIEKGLDGFVYVMVAKTRTGYHVAEEFRIMKMAWNDANKTLTPIGIVVDKFPSAGSSEP